MGRCLAACLLHCTPNVNITHYIRFGQQGKSAAHRFASAGRPIQAEDDVAWHAQQGGHGMSLLAVQLPGPVFPECSCHFRDVCCCRQLLLRMWLLTCLVEEPISHAGHTVGWQTGACHAGHAMHLIMQVLVIAGGQARVSRDGGCAPCCWLCCLPLYPEAPACAGRAPASRPTGRRACA